MILKKKKIKKNCFPVLDCWYFKNKTLYVDSLEIDINASRKHLCANAFKMSTEQFLHSVQSSEVTSLLQTCINSGWLKKK